jgi:ADP-heptose:LPS heptosyltransferase
MFMRLKPKIYIDKLFGNPTVFCLNIISLFLQLFKKENEPDNSKIKRIAVCKFMGMGSILQSTPLLLTLRDNFPGVEITFITSPRNYELVETFTFVDKIVTINDASPIILVMTFFRTLIGQWIKRTDIFIDLEVYSYFSKILMVLCFPRYKFGFYKKESGIQLGVCSKMIYFNTKAPVYKIYLQVAYFLKCKHQYDELYDWKSISKCLHASPLIKSFGLNKQDKKYIIINPNASDLRIERRWDAANYIELIAKILFDYPEKKIVLTGSQEEKAYVEKIFNGIKKEHRDKILNTSGELTLKELITLINGCSLMVTNDSGPMHIAFALKKKVIALFGPCSPQEYITNQNVYFIYKNIYCSPCVHHFVISPCNGDNQCMKLIIVNEVMKAVKEVINNEIEWKQNHFENGILYNSLIEGVPFGINERN